MKQKTSIGILFLFSLFAFFLLGVAISRADNCECTNNPNSPFSGAWCSANLCADGCHCSCIPNCSCASGTLVGSTCSDGCGGSCNGTKIINPAPSSNCGTAANNNYACNMIQTTGALCASGVTCYPNTGYPPSPCPTNIQFSGNQAHWYCGTDQNCYANKLSSCGGGCTPSCSCAYNTPVGSTCPDGCQGICQGKKNPNTGCLINCGCAPNTPVGATCDNGCGGTCAGTRDPNQPNNNCYSSSNNSTKQNGSHGYYSLDWWNLNLAQYYQPGTRLFKEKCEGSDLSNHICRIDSGGAVYWTILYSAIISQRSCDLNSGQKCIVNCIDPINWRAFLVPGINDFEMSPTTTDESALLSYVAKYNDLPTKTPSSSIGSSCYGKDGTVGCNKFTFSTLTQGQEFSGMGFPSDGKGDRGYLSENDTGWLYYKGVEIQTYPGTSGMNLFMSINAKVFNDWLAHSGSNSDGSINWEKDVESVITYKATDPDCAAKTCKGISCYDGTGYVYGTRTEGCATGTATVTPAMINAPGSSYVKWIASGASKMEAECLTGPIILNHGGWFTNDTECKNSGLVRECSDKGYEFKFTANQIGTEVCAFYPTNTSDGKPGTPFTATITSTKDISTCSNGILDSGEDCDGTNHPCATGKTCTNCKCVTSDPSDPAIQRICKPDNPDCEKETCNKYYCWDGCAYLKGTSSKCD